jgi:hypothetical protein
MKEQFRKLGVSYDWDEGSGHLRSRLITAENQWVF